MMRPLHMATAIAASAVLLAACGTDPRAEAASARVGAAAPEHDTELAADSGFARRTLGYDTAVVRESGGTLDSSSLSAYLTTSDLMLDRYFQALILRLESEAGVTSGVEPPAVKRLRAAQRAWVTYRDDECRKRTRAREGLWAPERARCLIDYSTQRTDELAGVLAERRALAPLDQPTRSAQPTPSTQRTKSTKPTPSKRSHPRKAPRHARTHRR